MKALYVIDAVNILFRSYYAIGNMTSPQGESTGALYGFIRSLQKLQNDFSPDAIVAVFDGPNNKASRTKIYKDYKGHRAGMPDDLVPQLGWAMDYCTLAGIPMLQEEGVEADDVMGSIATWAENQGYRVFLCSSDKDLCQLVSKHVHMLHIHKDNRVVDSKGVQELFGVLPEQMIDYLAIVGDASDNIPGLEGFGPKTASSLLQEFKTLDTILAHPEKIKGAKKQETVREQKQLALMSRELATIDLKIPIPHKTDFYHLQTPDIGGLRKMYEKMHFLSLLKTLPSKEGASKTGNYQIVQSEKELLSLIETLSSQKEVCVDTETTHVRPLFASLVGIGLGYQSGEAWYIPFNGSLSEDVLKRHLAPFFASEKIAFFGHNIKYDAHILINAALPIKVIGFDTMVASQLIAPQLSRHNLDELTLEKFGKKKIEISSLIGKGKKQISMRDVPIEKVGPYCCEDVDYTIRLKEALEEEMELKEVYETLELPLIPVLIDMEHRGIKVDGEELKELSKEMKKKISALEKEIFDQAGQEFNLNSPKQLSHVLFEKMAIPAPKKTQTGFSTAAPVLQELSYDYPIVHDIIEYRMLEKLRSTYADALPEQIHPQTGRIHCTFNQLGTATGRLSCQDPNLQNIPVRSEEGRKIRKAFKPGQRGWSLLSADYSQIELRLLAHFSEEPHLIKAFEEGEDVHAFTASLIFGVPLKEVSSEMRSAAKTVNFGILYGQSAFGLSKELGISKKEAALFIESYFKRYSRVQEYLDGSIAFARKNGYAMTLSGRKRPIPDITNKNFMIRGAAERLAINTPLQGSSADLIKAAMIDIEMQLSKKEMGHMLLQIHDELVFESPDSQINSLKQLVKKSMEGAAKLKVPLVVDISIGKNWEEC